MNIQRFIVIEDDLQQAETISRALRRRYPEAQTELIETENDFYHRFDRLTPEERKLTLIISDVMLPWAYPAQDTAHALGRGASVTFRVAGVRCWQRSRSQGNMVPWVYFTVLDEASVDFDSHRDAATRYVQKSSSIKPLFDAIAELTAANRPEEPVAAVPNRPKRRRSCHWRPPQQQPDAVVLNSPATRASSRSPAGHAQLERGRDGQSSLPSCRRRRLLLELLLAWKTKTPSGPPPRQLRH